MRTQTTTVYTFDELDARAKDRARDWWRHVEEGDNFWAEAVIEDAARMAAILGIELTTSPVKLMGGGTRQDPQVYWSLGGQGSGACFVGRYRYKAGSVKAIASEAAPVSPANIELNRIARELMELQKAHFWRLSAKVEHRGNYSHEHATTITVYNEQTGNEADADTTEALADLLRDFMRWIYGGLEAEYQVHDLRRAR